MVKDTMEFYQFYHIQRNKAINNIDNLPMDAFFSGTHS